MTIKTISQFTNIITSRKCEDYQDKEIYVIDDVKKRIVGKVKFLKLDIKTIVLKSTYKA